SLTATGYVAAATDAENDALTYSIAGGADAALFGIDAATGALSFLAAPNFEAPGDAGGNNVYDVTLRVSDGVHTVDRAVMVTVTNVNDVAPVFT
ncbi:cadherin repeat domain-containing protein, partial [Asticcacaulis sp. AC402]|uniref:cadherin repeat domain-containing protein n=1 Tax=Asticcacaulis sp. AC402 TaxID=1282361 RepID=UPI00058F3CB9